MKLDIIGAAIEAVYYAGRPKADKKMDRADFEQLARMAHATLMRKMYFQSVESETSAYLYFADQIETKEFAVGKPDRSGRRVFDLEANREVLRLPNGVGIFAILLAGDLPAHERKFHAGEVGGEWLYSDPAYDGTKIFIKKGLKVYLYGMPRDAGTVEVDGLFNDEDIDIPDDVAFDMVVDVLRLVLPSRDFIVDKTDDNNPNVQTVRRALANPASL